MTAFCLFPTTLAFRSIRLQMSTQPPHCRHRVHHMFARQKTASLPFSPPVSSSPTSESTALPPSMSLKTVSYAAAAIILASIPTNSPLNIQPTLASALNSAPLRFSQSLQITQAGPEKFPVQWDVRSVDSRTETFIFFSNDTNSVVDLWWIDYYGKEVYYASINPGVTHMQPSYATHPWVVRDHISQNSLLVMVATPKPSEAFVEDSP